MAWFLRDAALAARTLARGTRHYSTHKYPIIEHTYDAIVVGAGGAGLRAAVGLAEQGFNAAYAVCESQVAVTSDHTLSSVSFRRALIKLLLQMHHQTVSDTVTHRGCPRWHQCGIGQHDNR